MMRAGVVVWGLFLLRTILTIWLGTSTGDEEVAQESDVYSFPASFLIFPTLSPSSSSLFPSLTPSYLSSLSIPVSSCERIPLLCFMKSHVLLEVQV